MGYCKNCRIWNEKYDEFRNDFNDCIIVDDSSPAPHFCIMYDDNIPPEIYYDGGKCPYFNKKSD